MDALPTARRRRGGQVRVPRSWPLCWPAARPCRPRARRAGRTERGPPAHAGAAPRRQADDLQNDYQTVIENVLPSVVTIEAGQSLGSGIVYDGEGHIVTNAHVVGDAETFRVTVATREQPLTAKLVSSYPEQDLAVIKLERAPCRRACGRPARELLREVEVGQIVLAMGSPLGLSGSVTQGIVSAIGRTVSADGSDGGTGATIGNMVRDVRAHQPGQQRGRAGQPGQRGHRHPHPGGGRPRAGRRHGVRDRLRHPRVDGADGGRPDREVRRGPRVRAGRARHLGPHGPRRRLPARRGGGGTGPGGRGRRGGGASGPGTSSRASAATTSPRSPRCWRRSPPASPATR